MGQYIINVFFVVIDFIILVGLFYIAHFLSINIEQLGYSEFNQLTLKDFIFVIFIIILLLYYEKIYNHRYDFWQETYKVFKVFAIAFFIVFALLALSKNNIEYSRIFIMIYFILGMILLPISKRFIKRAIYSFDYFKKKILIIASFEEKKILKKEFKQNWYMGQRYAKKNYDSVIISSKGFTKSELNIMIEKYSHNNRELYIIPYITEINFANSIIMEFANIRYSAIQVENKLLQKGNIFIKNIFDKVLSLIIFLPLILVHLLIYILIKIDSKGNVFFKQKRLGENGRTFNVYKYRTMYLNGDEILDEYLARKPDEIEYYEKYHKYQNDPRITKVGKILRDTSLDELPQIINVFRGDMSFIGPRPYMLNESHKLGKNKEIILKVKPGITGLWQVSGRNNLTFKQRNELESWYIKNWSLWGDFVILIKTIKVVFAKVGAK